MVLLAVVGMASSLTAQYFAAKAALGYGTALRGALFRHIDTLSYTELKTPDLRPYVRRVVRSART